MKKLLHWIFTSFVLVSIVCEEFSFEGIKRGVCPESKRRHPRECQMFYKCVPVPVPGPLTIVTTKYPNITHAHIWLPTRCTAGLVFQSELNECVLPDDNWDCRNEDQLIAINQNSNIINNISDIYEDITEENIDDHKVTMSSFQLLGEENPIVEEIEIIDNILDRRTTQKPNKHKKKEQSFVFQSQHLPIPASNINDNIANQMNRIADLVDSLKAVRYTTPSPVIPSPSGLNNSPLKQFIKEPQYHLNLLPIQLNKITAQYQIPTKQSSTAINAHKKHPTDLVNIFHLSIPNTSTSTPFDEQYDTEQLVSLLFNKYLNNKIFNKPTVSNYVSVTKPVESEIDSVTSTTILPCISGVRLPNKTDCRRYYMCNQTKITVIHNYICPPYTAFDRIRRMCDVSQYAWCINLTHNNNEINGNEQELQKLRGEDICATRDKVPDITSIRRYLLCVKTYNGRWTQHQITCPGTLIFCPRRNICSPKSSCY